MREEVVGAHPLRERLWEQLMLALYRCGRQADALDAWQDHERQVPAARAALGGDAFDDA